MRDGCAGIAVPSVAGDSLKLSALAPGSCSVVLAATGGVTARLAVEVGNVLGPVALAASRTPLTLSRSAAILARGTSAAISLSQGAYGGPFSVTGDCKGIANVEALGNSLTVVGARIGAHRARRRPRRTPGALSHHGRAVARNKTLSPLAVGLVEAARELFEQRHELFFLRLR